MRRIAKKDLARVTMSTYELRNDNTTDKLNLVSYGHQFIETIPAIKKRVEKSCKWFLDTSFSSGEDCHEVRITRQIVIIRLTLHNGEREFIAYDTDSGWIENMNILPLELHSDIIFRP